MCRIDYTIAMKSSKSQVTVGLAKLFYGVIIARCHRSVPVRLSMPYIECVPGGKNTELSTCQAERENAQSQLGHDIGYPIWKINGKYYLGTQSLQALSREHFTLFSRKIEALKQWLSLKTYFPNSLALDFLRKRMKCSLYHRLLAMSDRKVLSIKLTYASATNQFGTGGLSVRHRQYKYLQRQEVLEGLTHHIQKNRCQ
jgi:hypothetical protein